MSIDGADPRMVREVLRDVLGELLPGLVAEARATSAPPPGATVAMFPPPPVAAVHRPSGWNGAAAQPAPPADAPRAVAGGGTVSEVSFANDAEVDAFVHRLLQLFENPRERAAIRSGKLRFVLRGSGHAPASPAVRRIERGAVSERVVREAAAAGARLVLGPKAVVTPMANDTARSLGVTIEKEKRC
ncbi:MAG TPA: hypothetical protein VGF46_12955 [Gaiellales bacterium]